MNPYNTDRVKNANYSFVKARLKNVNYCHSIHQNLINEKAKWWLYCQHPLGVNYPNVSKRFAKHLRHLGDLQLIQDKLLNHKREYA